MFTSHRTSIKRIAILSALALAACRQTPAPTATPAPTLLPPPSVTPAAATATPDPALGPGFLVAAPDKRVFFVRVDGQERPLGEAPETRYVLADLSAEPSGQRSAYAVGPQGAQALDFAEAVGQGLAAYQPPSGPGRLAWDNWTNNAATGQVDSKIFLSGLDGSGTYAALEDSGDHVLRVIRWSGDGQRLFFSREPLGLGGYILFSGFSSLWEMNAADGSTRQIVANNATRAICLDDISPDESQVAHHCEANVITVLSPGGGGETQIGPPAEVTGFGVMGDARFSPDGSRLAFAVGRNAPEAEQGWVAVSQGMSGAARLVATAEAGDYFSVWGWVDDQTLVLQSHGAMPRVWVVGAEGGGLRRVADGMLLGVVGR